MKPDAPAVWLPTIRAGTGSDVFTERLCDGLNAKGIRAEITWLPHYAEYAPWLVAIPQAPAWANVVHVNSWMPGRFIPQQLPAVATVHHLVHDPAFYPYKSAAQATYHALVIRSRELRNIRRAQVVTVEADYVRKTVVKFSGRESIEVIPLWVEMDVFRPIEFHPGQRKKFQVFTAGSRNRRKGFEWLPRLCELLGDNFEVRHAGSSLGFDDSRISNFVELGRISETQLVQEYQQCDAVLSLSKYEGFGYTGLEAMAFAKPFVGFNTSGLSEVVDDKCSFLAEVGDVDGLVTALKRLATDPELAVAMGKCGLNRASEKFTRHAAIDSYIEVYSRLTPASS